MADHSNGTPSTHRGLEVRYDHSPTLPTILENLQATLLITTYQAGKLLAVGAHDGRLQVSFSNYDHPMGVAASPQGLAVGTRREVHFFRAAHETVAGVGMPGSYRACYVPRASFCTGAIRGHDLAWGRDGLWVVNTLFSCLCTLHEDYSFVPRWRPAFVTELADEDRCHLNGLAMEGGVPRYVTALGETNDREGWRAGRATGGCLIDVTNEAIVTRGLSMPHSPRVHGGQLWVLNSGHGVLATVDRRTGKMDVVERVPGYARGLAFAGNFAFVGLSRIRESAVFGGLPLERDGGPLHCGVAVIDLLAGRTVAVFQFLSGVEEIFGLEVLPGAAHTLLTGSLIDGLERDIWVVPAPTIAPPSPSATLPWYASTRPTFSTDQIVTDDHASAPAGFAASSPVAVADALRWRQEAARYEMQGDLPRAINAMQRVVSLLPEPSSALVPLGNLLQLANQSEDAAASYLAAIEADTSNVTALQNLGLLYVNLGEPERAREQYGQLVSIAPTPLNKFLAASALPIVYDSLDHLQAWRGDQISALQRMVRNGETIDLTDQLVPTAFYWAYHGQCDREVMQLRGSICREGEAEARDARTRPMEPNETSRAEAPRARRRGARGRLRVGFLSAYLRDHTIGRLNVGRVERLDRSRFEVTVITTMPPADPTARRFQAAADRYHVLSGGLPEARRQVRELDLDLLLFADVGMDPLCSTLAFSRMATVQCVTWGHPETTGSEAMDYFLSSDLLEVADADAHYTERLVRMPLLGVYYERPRRTGPPRSREHFGLPANRHLYLCPQTLFKFHPDYDALLSAILAADPAGTLVLLEGKSPAWTARLQSRFRKTLGDANTRVIFLPPQPNDDYLGLFQVADVVLDPIHFGGGNSSYEAIAMGVPLVTLPGDFLRSRITTALYRKMKLPGLIADDAQAYVELAVRLGTDEKANRATRQEIEAKAGVLFEDPAEVRALESFFDSCGA